MHLGLTEKVFVVSGAAQGIGAAIVRALVAEGACVAALDIDAAGLEPLALEGRVTCHAGDLSSPETAAALCEAALQKFGRVDGLVCAAGGVCGQAGGPLEAVEPEGWQAVFAANVDAAMWCAQALAPPMRRAGSGRIVTISSGAGLRPSLTGIQAYAAAKHALVGLTRQLALELGPDGITVNSVAPGFILSNPSTARQWEAFGFERQQQVIADIHLRRLGSAQDIADAVLFLCSARASWVTGQVLQVDGGRA